MIRLVNALLFLCAILSLPQISRAQTCNYTIEGVVTDKQQQAIPGAIVRLLNDSLGAATDTLGHFSFPALCLGKHTLICTAGGFLPFSMTVDVSADSHLKIRLLPNELEEVTVNGKKLPDLRTVTQTELTGKTLQQTRGASLGDALKELPGLNTIQTGPTLAKPVIHGLHSNRVLIINDGVRQEGQQWGSEHAPEIDPFIAEKITIIKGAASVRYGSDAIGGVVLVSPKELPSQKGITGDLNLVGATNGQMGVASVTLQGAFGGQLKGLSWRVQGTLRNAGNFHTPRYYLTNTGLKENDYSATIGYTRKQFSINGGYSEYYTRVGIFYGAESGNLSELQAKFSLATPGLPSYFSYVTTRPYQTILHQLLKSVATYSLPNNNKLELTFGRQNDIRQEYDELNTSNPMAAGSPQLRFQLITHTLDLVYNHTDGHGFSGMIGCSGKTSGNSFEGARSLIPNYRDYNGGLFAIEEHTKGKLTLEAGTRLDYRTLRVYERNPTTLELYNVGYKYVNATGTIGATYKFSNNLSASLNTGTAWRAPSINEMYIYGEHFSDASFQVGDSTLKSERSINTGLSVRYTSHKLTITADMYYNHINNYIYDKPALTYRQLASGIFPEFDFTQANANIKGTDVSMQYEVLPHVSLQSKTTIVRGYNTSIQNWLIGMPCDRFENGIEYHLSKLGGLQEPYISIENVSVLKQTRVPPNSDYVSAPAGYSLLNAEAGFKLLVRHNMLDLNFSVTNILNTAYRDYLDHFRYYTDQLGVNYTLRVKFSF